MNADALARLRYAVDRSVDRADPLVLVHADDVRALLADLDPHEAPALRRVVDRHRDDQDHRMLVDRALLAATLPIANRVPLDPDPLRAFVAALAHRPDTHDVLTVATRESGHRDVTLVLGDLRATLAELDRLRALTGGAA